MKRRTFLEIALVLGVAGAAGPSSRGAALAWSRHEGFPGLRVRLDGLNAATLPAGTRLVVVDVGPGSDHVLLDRPAAAAEPGWRIPALRRGLADAEHALEARLVAADGRVLERTDPPLSVRFRAHRFSV